MMNSTSFYLFFSVSVFPWKVLPITTVKQKENISVMATWKIVSLKIIS